MHLNYIENLLNAGIDSTIVKPILSEYSLVKKQALMSSSENVIKHGGIFAELTMAAIKFLADGTLLNLNQIQFGRLLEEFENAPKPNPEDELLLLSIPRTAHAVYTLRSKKKVVHFKLIDPLEIDSVFVVRAVDWMLASLIFYIHRQDVSADLTDAVRDLLRKDIPIIEEFEDGDLVVLDDLGTRKEMILLLNASSERISKERLRTLARTYRQDFDKNFRALQTNRHIHENAEGVKLTAKGIGEAEKIISEAMKARNKNPIPQERQR